MTQKRVVDKIAASQFTIVNAGQVIDMANARTSFTSGGNTRYIGAGFGPSNQYIDWFGPDSISLNALSDSASKFFVKANGAMQFAGRLRGEFEPKAWAVFSASATGVIINDCFNIGSITRTTQGDYNITFATALPNPYYVVVGSAGETTPSASTRRLMMFPPNNRTTTGLRAQVWSIGNGNLEDTGYIALLVFGSTTTSATANNVTNPGGGGWFGTYGGGNLP